LKKYVKCEGKENMWYEVLYRVLSIINYIVLIVVAIPILIQILYVVFSFVKKRTWAKSEKKGRIAFIIPAYNEEDVIYDTVKSVIDGQNYPKDKFDVYVVADNCTDRTAELAEKAGAKVLIHNDPDPAHHMALYPLKYGIDYLINLTENPYDLVIHLDADNHINAEFASLMNDAYQSGVEFARPYEGALNSTQNFYTKACSLFYSFDSRYGSRVRERFGLAAHVDGSGATMAVSLLKRTHGYDSVTIADDAEYSLNRMLEGVKAHFVEDAIVYQDSPSTYKDTAARNRRIGHGVMNLMKSKFTTIIKTFFKTGNMSLLEMLSMYMLNFLNVVIAIWFPLFYAYHFLYTGFAAYGYIQLSMCTPEYYYALFWNTIIIGLSILVALFIFFGFIQAFILVMIDYKKLGATKRSQLMGAVPCFPAFLIVYALTLGKGAVSKPKKWEKIKRNKTTESNTTTDDIGADEAESQAQGE
jgi:cellulose synthase/poly-beta-1,6-N-acetylglucosamine synthase-like glycosyltransferase